MAWVQGNVEAWWREYHQRQSSADYLKLLALHGKVIALICDADEIPSIPAIEYMKDNYEKLTTYSAIHLGMSLHYYSWELYEPEAWIRAFALTSEHIRKSPRLNEIRTSKPQVILGDGAGWHCTYFMDPQGICDKIQAFSHLELDIPEFTNENHITECMNLGKDLFQHGRLIQKTPLHILKEIPFTI